LRRAEVQVASPVVSLTSGFGSILNRTYKSATQQAMLWNTQAQLQIISYFA